jgi:hypothetical protein
MFKKIKNYAVALALVASFAAPALVPVAASADTNTSNKLCQGANLALGNGADNTTCSTDASNNSLGNIATRVVNLLSLVVGVIAVIMIIIGGLRYIISGGESSNVSGAKNTLIYAIVGLIIVALAQFIVHFVINTAGNSVAQ